MRDHPALFVRIRNHDRWNTVFKDTLRQHFAKRFASHELSRWFDPLHMRMDEEEGVLRISFPHTFFGDWFMHTIRGDFERCAADCSRSLSHEFSIVYEGAAHYNEQKRDAVPSSSFIQPAPRHTRGGEALSKEQSFDAFLVNRKNDFPLAAAKEFTAQELSGAGERLYFSPFVMYGQSGSGKSHLLAAMVNALRDSGRSFHHGDVAFLESIRVSPGRYAKVNEMMVFLDDMQRVSSCPDLQDALVALVDMFQSSGRLLALAFDSHPTSCAGLGQNLRTRLCSGLVVELKRPDLDIRRQYVQRKDSQLNLGLTREQMLNLAQRFQDLRNIDGALTRLLAYRSLLMKDGSDAHPPDIATLLTQGMESESLTPPHIIAICAKYFSVSPEDMIGKSRDKTVALARHVGIWLCRELLGLSLVQTGRVFGGRDHSSILYSIKKIRLLRESDKVTNKLVEDLRKLCLTRQS